MLCEEFNFATTLHNANYFMTTCILDHGSPAVTLLQSDHVTKYPLSSVTVYLANTELYGICFCFD